MTEPWNRSHLLAVVAIGVSIAGVLLGLFREEIRAAVLPIFELLRARWSWSAVPLGMMVAGLHAIGAGFIACVIWRLGVSLEKAMQLGVASHLVSAWVEALFVDEMNVVAGPIGAVLFTVAAWCCRTRFRKLTEVDSDEAAYTVSHATLVVAILGTVIMIEEMGVAGIGLVFSSVAAPGLIAFTIGLCCFCSLFEEFLTDCGTNPTLSRRVSWFVVVGLVHFVIAIVAGQDARTSHAFVLATCSSAFVTLLLGLTIPGSPADARPAHAVGDRSS